MSEVCSSSRPFEFVSRLKLPMGALALILIEQTSWGMLSCAIYSQARVRVSAVLVRYLTPVVPGFRQQRTRDALVG